MGIDHRVGLFISTAGPNTALVRSGKKSKPDIVIGGRLFAVPIFQRVDALSLSLRTITVHTSKGLTVNGVAVDVTSACQVKIQGWSADDDAIAQSEERIAISGRLHMDENAIRLAAQHFLGKNDEMIEESIKKTIAGHQRAIIGVLTVEELYRDRAAFSKRVLDLCSADMRNMGLTVVSYTLAEISDANGYIEALGVTQTETVKREAQEGAALHQAAAKMKSSQEEANAHLEVNRQAERKINSDKERAVRYAIAQGEVDRSNAVKAKQHDITTAQQDAILLVERQKAEAAKAKAELEVMRQEVEQERLKMIRKVHVDADAKLYKAKVEAEAVRTSAKAAADRIKMTGEAEASAIRSKGVAEVEVLLARNKAWKEVGSYGAIMEKIVKVLPSVAEAVARPLSKTEKMVFVSGGGRGGGPSDFISDANRVVAEVPQTVRALTGFDMTGSMNLMDSHFAGSSPTG